MSTKPLIPSPDSRAALSAQSTELIGVIRRHREKLAVRQRAALQILVDAYLEFARVPEFVDAVSRLKPGVDVSREAIAVRREAGSLEVADPQMQAVLAALSPMALSGAVRTDAANAAKLLAKVEKKLPNLDYPQGLEKLRERVDYAEGFQQAGNEARTAVRRAAYDDVDRTMETDAQRLLITGALTQIELPACTSDAGDEHFEAGYGDARARALGAIDVMTREAADLQSQGGRPFKEYFIIAAARILDSAGVPPYRVTTRFWVAEQLIERAAGFQDSSDAASELLSRAGARVEQFWSDLSDQQRGGFADPKELFETAFGRDIAAFELGGSMAGLQRDVSGFGR